jgi:DNA-nicking Smr family endonuclease
VDDPDHDARPWWIGQERLTRATRLERYTFDRVHLFMGKRRVSRPNAVTPRTLHMSVVMAELDLHGFTAEGAARRLEGFLDAQAVRTPGEVVRVITGKGTRSDGAPVLQQRVRELLTGPLRHRVDDWAVDMGGGAYLVRLPK